VTTFTADAASKATLHQMVINDHGNWRRMREALVPAVGPGGWGSRMDRTAQQQACELAQLHRSNAKIANMLETQTALQEAPWEGINKWLEENEEKWDTYHQDD